MARQPRHALNLNLRQLSLNPATGLYEAEEYGIIYHLSFEQMNDLKRFYFGSQGYSPTYENWYNHLDRFKKKKIIRTGNLPVQKNDFYPDREPEY